MPNTNLQTIQKTALKNKTALVAVSKGRTAQEISDVYNTGHKIFGESKTQELRNKYQSLPKDIEWHMIGHLQKNKIKYIIPFVSLIHSVDSLELLKAIDKQARKCDRIVPVLLQIKIDQENTKFGLTEQDIPNILAHTKNQLPGVQIAGLMGMASNTTNKEQIKKEFQNLANVFQKTKNKYFARDPNFKELSMGMSSDYKIALEEGATIVRIGTAIFE